MAVIGGTSVLHYSIIPRLARQRAVVLPSTRFTPAQRRHRTSGVGAGPHESSQKSPNWRWDRIDRLGPADGHPGREGGGGDRRRQGGVRDRRVTQGGGGERGQLRG